MSCSYGCAGGGGQPKLTLLEMKEKKKRRLQSIEKEDDHAKIRFCHKNPEIEELYQKFLGKPNSLLAEKLLHTSFKNRSYLLGGKDHA